jgi:hypothetical protein
MGKDPPEDLEDLQEKGALLSKILKFYDEYFLISIIFLIVNIIGISYALYLAFKCKNGFDLVQFLLACCCWVLYIPYRLTVPCKKGSSNKKLKTKN